MRLSLNTKKWEDISESEKDFLCTERQKDKDRQNAERELRIWGDGIYKAYSWHVSEQIKSKL